MWKEKYLDKFDGFHCPEHDTIDLAGQEISFIETQVIKKLIDEIPDMVGGTPNPEGGWIKKQEWIGSIKQQLRAKWLHEEGGK